MRRGGGRAIVQGSLVVGLLLLLVLVLLLVLLQAIQLLLLVLCLHQLLPLGWRGLCVPVLSRRINAVASPGLLCFVTSTLLRVRRWHCASSAAAEVNLSLPLTWTLKACRGSGTGAIRWRRLVPTLLLWRWLVVECMVLLQLLLLKQGLLLLLLSIQLLVLG